MHAYEKKTHGEEEREEDEGKLDRCAGLSSFIEHLEIQGDGEVATQESVLFLTHTEGVPHVPLPQEPDQ